MPPAPGRPAPARRPRPRYNAAWEGIVSDLAIRVCNIRDQAVRIGAVRAQGKQAGEDDLMVELTWC